MHSTPREIHFCTLQNTNIFRLRRALHLGISTFVPFKTPNIFVCGGLYPLCTPIYVPLKYHFFRLRRACPLSVFSSKSVSVPCPLSVFGSKPAPYPVPCPLPKPFRTPTFRTPKIHFFRTPGPKSAPYPVPCPFLAQNRPVPLFACTPNRFGSSKNQPPYPP